VIGVLGSASFGAFPGVEFAFIQGLQNTSFIEGTKRSIEWRWAEGRYNRLSSLAGEPMCRNVAVIVTWDAPASFAAQAVTKTVPIVFFTGADPVEICLVQNFSRPSGNLTPDEFSDLPIEQNTKYELVIIKAGSKFCR
jgi:putative tryptophan/tyrosine transport system substrate-binding protein